MTLERARERSYSPSFAKIWTSWSKQWVFLYSRRFLLL